MSVIEILPTIDNISGAISLKVPVVWLGPAGFQSGDEGQVTGRFIGFAPRFDQNWKMIEPRDNALGDRHAEGLDDRPRDQ